MCVGDGVMCVAFPANPVPAVRNLDTTGPCARRVYPPTCPADPESTSQALATT